MRCMDGWKGERGATQSPPMAYWGNPPDVNNNMWRHVTVKPWPWWRKFTNDGLPCPQNEANTLPIDINTQIKQALTAASALFGNLIAPSCIFPAGRNKRVTGLGRFYMGIFGGWALWYCVCLCLHAWRQRGNSRQLQFPINSKLIASYFSSYPLFSELFGPILDR